MTVLIIDDLFNMGEKEICKKDVGVTEFCTSSILDLRRDCISIQDVYKRVLSNQRRLDSGLWKESGQYYAAENKAVISYWEKESPDSYHRLANEEAFIGMLYLCCDLYEKAYGIDAVDLIRHQKSFFADLLRIKDLVELTEGRDKSFKSSIIKDGNHQYKDSLSLSTFGMVPSGLLVCMVTEIAIKDYALFQLLENACKTLTRELFLDKKFFVHSGDGYFDKLLADIRIASSIDLRLAEEVSDGLALREELIGLGYKEGPNFDLHNDFIMLMLAHIAIVLQRVNYTEDWMYLPQKQV